MPPAIRPLSSHLNNPGVYHNGRINLSTYLFTYVMNENLYDEIIDFEYDIEKKKITGFAKYPKFEGKSKDNGKFVGKDGLYLALHIDHPLYNPDRLTFERMEIIRK